MCLYCSYVQREAKSLAGKNPPATKQAVVERMERVEFSSLKYDDDARMCYQGKLFTGVAIARWPNDQLAAEQTYVDGVEDGWSRE